MKKRKLKIIIVFIVAAFVFIASVTVRTISDLWKLEHDHGKPYVLRSFAESHNIPLSEYPQKLIDLLNRNPETQDFVLNYPLMKDKHPVISLNGGLNDVPLYTQWDLRWGYDEYAGDMMGLSGCGPTCLSMVSSYLLDDPNLSPQYIARFSTEHGYAVDGDGSSWTLISEGGPLLGLDVTELPLDKNRIISNLEVRNPVICVVGEGDFTSSGHFIVLTGVSDDGRIRLNDPNSPLRSAELWDYERLAPQLRAIWACRV